MSSWTWTKAACACVCPPPDITIEFKDARGKPEFATTFDFSLIDWGEAAFVFDGGWLPDGVATGNINYTVTDTFSGMPPEVASSTAEEVVSQCRIQYVSNGLDVRLVLRTATVTFNPATRPTLPNYTYDIQPFLDIVSSGTDGDIVTAFEGTLPLAPIPPEPTPDDPQTNTHVILIGPAIPPPWTTVATRYHGVLTKAGFHAYSESSLPPVIYRREALSGVLSGVQEWAYNAPPSPPPQVDGTSGLQTYTTTITGDGLKYQSLSFPDYRPVTAPVIETPEQRHQTISTGTLNANLSEEYLTADLVSQLDALVDGAVLIPEVVNYGSDITNPPEQVAIRYTTPDEATYVRAQVNLAPAIALFTAFAAGNLTLTFRYHKKVTVMETGVVESDADETVSVTANGEDPVYVGDFGGDQNQYTVDPITPVVIDAADGRLVQITAIGFDPLDSFEAPIVLQYPP